MENYKKLEKFLSVNKIKNPIEDFIQQKINDSIDRRDLSCRKLAQKYKEETGNSVSKSKVNEIIKYKMGYSYLKSTVKSNKIIQKENILISFAFLKIMCRCIKLGYKIIYLDESGLMLGNNNYRCIRKKFEQVYFNIANREKRNLLLAILFLFSQSLDPMNNHFFFLTLEKEMRKKNYYPLS